VAKAAGNKAKRTAKQGEEAGCESGFCGVKRFLSLHKSFVKLAEGNPARFASPDFNLAGAGLRKFPAVRRNSL